MNKPLLYFLVFLFLLLPRLIVVFTLPDIYVDPDSKQYLELAESVQEGRFVLNGQADSLRTPGYPAFLAGLQRVGLGNPRSVAAAQALVSSWEGMLILALARRHFGANAAWIAVVLYALNPADYVYIGALLTETLFSFVLTLMVFILTRESAGNIFNAGVLCGVGALVRPIAVWLYIPLLALIVWREGWNRRMPLLAGVFLLAAIGLQGMWVSRNANLYNEFYFSEIPTANLYIYWAQAVRADVENTDLDPLIAEAVDEWYDARKGFAPPEMIRYFGDKARGIINGNYGSVAKIGIAGAYRQCIESGFTQLVRRYQPERSLRASDLVGGVIHPAGIGHFIISLGLLGGRLMETCVLSIVYCAAVISFCIGMYNKEPNDTRWLSLVLFVVIAYLFVLSSGPAASTRFREQYSGLLFLLASPVLASLYDWGRSKLTRSSHPAGSMFSTCSDID